MTSDERRHTDTGSDSGETFEHHVSRKQERRKKAIESQSRHLWYGVGMFGLVGWSVTVPTLLFTALGVWADSRFDTPYSWTLMGLVAGVAIGCVNAWFWVSRESRS